MSAPVPVAQGTGTAIAGAPGMLGMLSNRLRDYASTIFKQQKPWAEVVDRTALSKPANLAEALGRIKKNTAYFKVNYLVVVLTTCVVTFLMHPSSLFVLGLLLAAWIYLLFIRQQPVVISGRQLSDREKMMAMSAISFVTIFFLTSVGTVFFSALSISLAVVCAHGALREPDNLFIDDAESQQSFLPLFPGMASVPTGVGNV
ncbi:prenylated rab acceptor family protein [Haematococcus lacustris]